jgi:XTP/dITP diphosphohydrolase
MLESVHHRPIELAIKESIMNEEKIIFATGNEGKMREIREILKDLGANVLSMKEAGADLIIVEDGTTFLENAEIKARAVWEKTGGIVLADDSGLVVDCLNGEPGIYSARYMGEDTSYEIKNQNLLNRAAKARGEERSARFVCSIAAILPDGRALHTEETMEGLLADNPVGEEGFGYDPIFYLPEFKKTAAELTMELKNEISHRGKALEAMKCKLMEYYRGKKDENTDCQ